MSEEILKALMKLFAIIAKQDSGSSSSKRLYVERFLVAQIANDQVFEYLSLYDEFLHEDDSKEETKKVKLISVKDSVRTLGICKKINKTLTQKQKIVVLVRLFELLKSDDQFSEKRMEILETVANVFNIPKEEYGQIESFVRSDEHVLQTEDNLVISDKTPQDLEVKYIKSEGLNGQIDILRVNSVGLYFLKYVGSSEALLNGLLISSKSVYLFAQGSTIRLPRGTVYYSDVIGKFSLYNAENSLSFNASITEHKFPNGTIALRNVEVSEKSGTLVGLMGASGAGKTTLLNILSGIEKPSKGNILINGVDLNKEYSKIKGIIGYIPQDDLLIEELSVFQNLYYNTKLCFKDLTEKELLVKVGRMLGDLGLSNIKDVKVGNPLNKKISGGQRKRLNIALELIREPSILFVDEPTSGLSSRDSENVMDLLKELSLKGRLIFVVIHQPSSDIYKMFDKLILLDTGGFPIYYGNPIEAVIHFKKETNQINSESGECNACGNVNPELLFNIIEAKVVDEYGNYLQNRKVPPSKWNDIFKEKIKITPVSTNNNEITQKLQLPNWFNQLKVFITRDVLSKIGNAQYLVINLLEAPLLAFILAYIIRYIDKSKSTSYSYMYNENIPAYIFMSIVVALFIGLTVSAEEIFKDRKILKRESFLNLSRSSYLFSKIGILFSISAIQTLLFVLIGNSIVGMSGQFWEYWFAIFSVSCFANILGLNISASFNSAVTIYILIPILIIPQMVLGGAMFSFDKLNENIGGGSRVSLIADAMASRWVFEALIVNQFVNNTYEKKLYPIEKELSQANYKIVYFIPKLEEYINNINSQIKSTKISKEGKAQFDILRNELISESDLLGLNDNKELLDELNLDNLNEDHLDQVDDLISKLKTLYTDKFAAANTKKENYQSKFFDDSAKLVKYENIKKRYYNESLADLATGALKKKKITNENGRLVQLIDPIYQDPIPNHYFDYRSHFYAPSKHFMGSYYSTYFFNIMVVWMLSLFLIFTLYFDVLSKLMGLFSKIDFKKWSRKEN
jgi:ABC transport system ATP-binding/permease protein